MANQGYLTYNAPSISELFGGMKPPGWLTEGVQYKPFEYQLAVADQMDKMAQAQAERDRQEQARAQIKDGLQGLDLSQTDPRQILTKVQQGLFDAGLIDQGINATRGLIRETKPQEPKIQKVGDALVQVNPDGSVHEIYKNDKPAKEPKSAKEDIYTNGQGDFKPASSAEEKIALMKAGYYKTTGKISSTKEDPEMAKLNEPPSLPSQDTSKKSGMLDEIGSWLQGFYNQPTVNPRSASSPTVDQGSLVSGDGTRRVITVRRKTVAQ